MLRIFCLVWTPMSRKGLLLRENINTCHVCYSPFLYLLKITQTLGVQEKLSECPPQQVCWHSPFVGEAPFLASLCWTLLPVWPPAAPSWNIQLWSHSALIFLVLLLIYLICQDHSLPLAESPWTFS